MKAIELEKAYNPKDFEDRIYAEWVEKGYFRPHSDKDSPVHGQKNNTNIKYTVVIPPPNVTGVLHMGHALNNTLQDVVVRYHRMRGDDTLWIPGTDHAGIATQNVVERQLKKEGLSRKMIGREKFLERTWAVKEDHHATIVKQQKKLGNSTDWTRERFTMDEGLSKAVREVFVTLYERGLIYKGQYLVNWCPRCGTALADDEVDHIDTKGAMYHLFYEYADGSGKIEVATTRPETFFGDTAVAVNPDDDRYKSLVGKMLKLPLTGKEIPIIADSYVDKEFGTGMVKITPAHDPNDWEVGKRHNLEIINLLNPDGTLNENVPEKYRGLKCEEARKLVIEDLTEAGLFKCEEPMTHSVGHCYRCKTVVEPYLSFQWFVKMRPLADKALKAWKDGEIEFFPRKWENTYRNWMENIRDWCISRQLWWGHRIPVWYCQDCGETIVSRTDPTVCPKCGVKADRLQQDPDVLDTWFSSWLWPFSTLGWPEKTADVANFYPTSALVTAYDIIFFWVSRMIMAGLEFTGKAPFHDIYIHGLVRDKQGRKMSKSLGNGIDPLDIIEQYGSDALKFTLSFLCAQGQDILIDNESFKMGSRFCNKVWNASRYILGNLEGRTLIPVTDADLTELDRWIYAAMDKAVRDERSALDGYRYNEAASTVYEFFWNYFCDWYVEATKLSFKNGDDHEKDRAVSVLLNVMEESLRMLHPFIPFVTEEIYSKLPLAEIIENRAKAGAQNILPNSDYKGKLVAAPFPAPTDGRVNETVTNRFAVLQDLIRAVRGLRNECGIDPATKLHIALQIVQGSHAEVCREKVEMISLLAGVAKIDFVDAKPAQSIGAVGTGFEAFILIDESINKDQLLARFKKDVEKSEAEAKRTEAKLGGSFAQHAPADVVQAERDKLEELKRRIEKVTEYIATLK
ncbi:MAG: valine--tRNA ligase [Treponema sp.]|nr:valine--tRNA ligase [Treponema sp.]